LSGEIRFFEKIGFLEPPPKMPPQNPLQSEMPDYNGFWGGRTLPYNIWHWGVRIVLALLNHGKSPLFMVSKKSVTIRKIQVMTVGSMYIMKCELNLIQLSIN
jgi:hypothetical protein